MAAFPLCVHAQEQGNEPPPPGRGGPPAAMRQACKDDVKSFCSDVQPGGGRIIRCLHDHYKAISDGCYAVLQKLDEGRGGKDNAPQDSGDSGSGN